MSTTVASAAAGADGANPAPPDFRAVLAGAKGDKGDKGDPGPGKTMLTATTSWFPGFLFAGQSSSTVVEVPDAEPGDPIVAGLSSIGLASPPFGFVPLPIYGYVESSGLVMVTITNLSPNMSATVPNGTLTVAVIKP